MRRVALAGLVAVVFASSAGAAEPTTYKAVVTDPEVKLRAGPSDTFPDTGTLPKGATVTVERDEGNGWLAVTAPKGSVSWIMFTFVEDVAGDRPAPRIGFVSHDGEVTVAAGKAGLAQPLNIRRERVPQGTALLIIGPTATFDGKKWLPIEPPAGDVRYLPKTAVKLEQPVRNNFTVRVNESVTPVPAGSAAMPAGGPPASIPGPSSTPTSGNGGTTTAKPIVNHPLWAQAENAEREGRLMDADKLYFQLAEELNRTGGENDAVNLCYTRIHELRRKQREAREARETRGTGNPIVTPPTATNLLKPPTKEKDDRGVRPGTPEALPPAAGAEDRSQTTATGVIRRSTLTPDGPNRALYMLESQGVVKMYLVAGQGVDLERYIGRRVDVYGTATSRNGLSKPYMVATSVDPVQ